MFIYNLDGEEADLILVGGTESTQVPVEDDRAAIETDTNLTRGNALVANVQGDTLVEVSARLGNGDRAQDGNVDLRNDLNAEVCEIVVDHDLIKSSCQISKIV